MDAVDRDGAPTVSEAEAAAGRGSSYVDVARTF